MVVVGLTGGIATGKSTAADVLRQMGAPVVSADELARAVLAPGEPALAEVAQAFGAGVIAPDGGLDRRALGALVFADAGARRRLEAITHPPIRQRTLSWLEACRDRGEPAAVCEIPLLFEVGLHLPGSFVDRIWVVATRPEVQRDRLMRRSGDGDQAAARARIAAQWPLARKVALADRVFENNGDPEQLAREVAAAWRALMAAVGSG